MEISMADENEIKDLAEDMVGNWAKWGSFAWFDDREDRHEHAIFNFRHRDSTLIEQSNGSVMIERLKQYLEDEDGDIEIQRHSHCMVGWIECFVVRVYSESGEVTEAFAKLAEMILDAREYPILDEDKYSELQFEVSWENFKQQFDYIRRQFNEDIPDEAIQEAHEWVMANHESEMEDTNDQGEWCSDEIMTKALKAIGYTIDE